MEMRHESIIYSISVSLLLPHMKNWTLSSSNFINKSLRYVCKDKYTTNNLYRKIFYRRISLVLLFNCIHLMLPSKLSLTMSRLQSNCKACHIKSVIGCVSLDFWFKKCLSLWDHLCALFSKVCFLVWFEEMETFEIFN